ncbi:hypothetical protein BDR04DRAFT_1112552 [Suillus decipiens]|nr:hypothetical protein BDR04DRAFT_1112552 [Suillus decipiens]
MKQQNATGDILDDLNTASPKKKVKKAGKSQELQLQDNDWPAKQEECLNAIDQLSPSLTPAFTSLKVFSTQPPKDLNIFCSIRTQHVENCNGLPTPCAYIMHHLDTNSAQRMSKRCKGNEKVLKFPSQTLIPNTHMDLLILLDEALKTLDSISPYYSEYTAGIREHIALKSIWALELLYSTRTTVTADRTMNSNVTLEEASRGLESSQVFHPYRQRIVLGRKDRLKALAQKDTK